jgi:hypothetical protein
MNLWYSLLSPVCRGMLHEMDGPVSAVTRTVRSRVFALPGRLVNRSGRTVLRLPKRWPWATSILDALDCLRALPLLA